MSKIRTFTEEELTKELKSISLEKIIEFLGDQQLKRHFVNWFIDKHFLSCYESILDLLNVKIDLSIEQLKEIIILYLKEKGEIEGIDYIASLISVSKKTKWNNIGLHTKCDKIVSIDKYCTDFDAEADNCYACAFQFDDKVIKKGCALAFKDIIWITKINDNNYYSIIGNYYYDEIKSVSNDSIKFEDGKEIKFAESERELLWN